MSKYFRYLTYAILAFLFWLFVEPLLDYLRSQTQLIFPPTTISVSIAVLIWLAFFWADHGGPFPLTDVWWSRVFLWRTMKQMREFHDLYVPISARISFSNISSLESPDVAADLPKTIRRNGEIIILAGDSGCGKSIALKVAAYKVAQNSFWSFDLSPIIPIYLKSPSLIGNNWDKTLRNMLEAPWSLEYSSFDAELINVLVKLLKKGRLALFCDGLDNLSSEQQANLVGLISQLKDGKNSRLTNIVLARRSSREELKGVSSQFEIQIRPLNDDEVFRFLCRNNNNNYEIAENLMGELRDAGWLDPSAPGRNPLHLSFIVAGGKINPNRTITLYNHIRERINETLADNTLLRDWNLVRHPNQMIKAIAYLAFQIQRRLIENPENSTLSLLDARRILKEFKDIRNTSGEEISPPDDILGTAALIGLLGPQAEQYYLHYDIRHLFQHENLVHIEFRHNLLHDFFVGIELGRIWAGLSRQERLVVIQDPIWWDEIIHMISFPDSRLQLLAELDEYKQYLPPGLVAGLEFTSLVVTQNADSRAQNQTVIHERQLEIQKAIETAGLLPEYHAMLGFISRWAPTQFLEFMVSLFDGKNGLSPAVQEELLLWCTKSSSSMTSRIILRAVGSGTLSFKENAQTFLLSSLSRISIGTVESKLLIGLLTNPDTFNLVFPFCVGILTENTPFVEMVRLYPNAPGAKLLVSLHDASASGHSRVFRSNALTKHHHQVQSSALLLSKMYYWMRQLENYFSKSSQSISPASYPWTNVIEERTVATYISILEQGNTEINELVAERLKRDGISRHILTVLEESDFLNQDLRDIIHLVLQFEKSRRKTPTIAESMNELTQLAGMINARKSHFSKLSDKELRAKTAELRRLIQIGESLPDEILPEAFAVASEAIRRVTSTRLDDVHLLAGIVLYRSGIVECELGNNHSYTMVLPSYLNALQGFGTHIMTLNDYLVRRTAREVAPIYTMLGLTVGALQMAAATENGKKAFLVDFSKESPHEGEHHLRLVDRRLAYEADVTYGTESEFGFDYLRDNMTMRLNDRVQRGHHFAIINEVDEVLIDKARTPLIISAPSSGDLEWYGRMAQVVKQLNPEDLEINEKDRNVSLTEIGLAHVEDILNMPLMDPDRPEDVTPEQARLRGYLEQAMRAQHIFKRNKDYLVQAGKVVIVDEFSGPMPGRRWSDGLHQAVEAKEGVKVEPENVTYATIALQNYFRMYKKLSGLTSTALTEIEEFEEIYHLKVTPIPTSLEYQTVGKEAFLVKIHTKDKEGYSYSYFAKRDDPERRPLFYCRKDYPDVIYKTVEAKLRSIVTEIIREHVRGRPLLIGTTSAEASEQLSSRLNAEAVHRLLQIGLVRRAWMVANNREEDGRLIPELQAFNEPLEKITTDALRKFIRPFGIATVNLKDPSNLPVVLDILSLDNRDSSRLKKVLQDGVPYQILSARDHLHMSHIIASAGTFGAVTIETNLVGRGLDIELGGDLAEEVTFAVNRVLQKAGVENSFDMTLEERYQALGQISLSNYGLYTSEVKFFLQYFKDREHIKQLGGLYVIGSERHEARRIDNQLRGRAARQGDPGSSRFFLSLQDDLMLVQGGSKVSNLMERLKVDDSLPLEARLVGNVIEQSQHRIEGANFDVRKHLLKYDDVLNLHRSEIYSQRDRIFVKEDLSDDISALLEEEVRQRVESGLTDEEGPWKLIAWLEQVQPPFMVGERLFPSFGLSLLLKELPDSRSIHEAVLRLVTRVIDAENAHHLGAIKTMIDKSEEGLEAQIASRTDSLDAYFDGLRDMDDAELPRPQKMLEEINGLVGVQLQLNGEQLKQLGEDPEELKDEIHTLVLTNLTRKYVSRVIAAVQNRFGESIGERFDVSNWDDAAEKILEASQNLLERRREHLVGNNGGIVHDIDNLTPSVVNDTSKLQLLLSLSQGGRTVFDQRTHRQVKQVFNRFTYIFLMAQLLNSKNAEGIIEDILTHLEEAQESLQMAWGEREYHRLAANAQRLADFGMAAKMAFGEERLNEAVSSLGESDRNRLVESIGKFTLNEVHRQLLLSATTELWVDYLTRIEALRVSIGLEAYAQRDPLVQYKGRASEMFAQLVEDIRGLVISKVFSYQPKPIESKPVEMLTEESEDNKNINPGDTNF